MPSFNIHLAIALKYCDKNNIKDKESFYRGSLFSTDFITSSKGVFKIENDDFSKLLEIVEKTKGF